MADIMKLVREWEAKRQGKSPSEKLAQKKRMEFDYGHGKSRRRQAVVPES